MRYLHMLWVRMLVHNSKLDSRTMDLEDNCKFVLFLTNFGIKLASRTMYFNDHLLNIFLCNLIEAFLLKNQ